MWPWTTTKPSPQPDQPQISTSNPPAGQVAIDDPIWRTQARFIGLTDEAAGWLADLGAEFDPDVVIARFFAKVEREPDLQAIIARHSTEARLKTAWTAHWRELTGGQIDDAYVARRLQIGQTHVRVGLGQNWYLGAYVWVFDELLQAIRRRYGADPDKVARATDAAFRLVAFDMQTGVEAYIQGVLRQRDERERALQRMSEEARERAAEADGMRERLLDAAAPLAAVAEELSAQAGEMGAGVERVAGAAAQFAGNARVAVDRSAAGQALTQEAAQVVSQTAGAVREMGGAMSAVEGRVGEIETFTNEIGQIASQTNLLALNAAIEAARAGHHGRGFAVVAGEMRRLADRTQVALGEIRRLAQEVRGAVAEASASAREVTAASERAQGAVTEAAAEFQGITAVTDQSLTGFETVTRDLHELASLLGAIARASDVVAGQAAGLSGR